MVIKKALWPFFVDAVQFRQGYKDTTRKQFTFYRYVLRNFWYSFDQFRKDERLSRPCSHQVRLNTGLLDWESSALTFMPFMVYI